MPSTEPSLVFGMLATILHKRTPILHGAEKILLIVRCSRTSKERKVQDDENILL